MSHPIDRIPPSLSRYVDTLRLTVPPLAQAVMAGAHRELQEPPRPGADPSERQHTHAALDVFLEFGDDRLADAWARELWVLVADELGTASADKPQSSGTEPGAAAFELKLVDDEQIEEDIEASRVIQQIESGAAVELRELQALCTTLRGLGQIGPSSHPMRPEVCMRALGRTVRGLPLTVPARLRALKVLGTALAVAVKATYAEQIRQLKHQGVEPAPYQVHMRSARAAEPEQDPLHRLVQRAGEAHRVQAAAQAAAEQALRGHAVEPLSLRMLDEPQGGTPEAPAAGAALDGAAAALLMGQLVAHFAREADLPAELHALLVRMGEPAARSARSDPAVWRSREHPLWQLLDRIATLGALHAGAGPAASGGTVLQMLEQVVARLERTQEPTVQDYTQAVTRVDTYADSAVQAEVAALQPQIQASDLAARRLMLEPLVRQQVAQQVDAVVVPQAVRRFLLGSWVGVLTHAMVQHGEASPEATRYGRLVDDVLAAAVVREDGLAGAPKRLPQLLAIVQQGLASTATQSTQLSAQLAELARALRNPAAALSAEPTEPPAPPSLDLSETSSAFGRDRFGPTEAMPAAPPTVTGTDFAHHGALPTVPIDLTPGALPTRASIDRESWLVSLRPGDRCRLFIDAGWSTRRLVWRSDNGQTFLFSGRRGEANQTITRRALARLRSEGLAATVAPGSLVERAMDTLPMGLEDD